MITIGSQYCLANFFPCFSLLGNLKNDKPEQLFRFLLVQSRPIEMRATILYLANRWTEFEMLLTPLRFLYLVMFSLLAFPSIPQFIAHFWQISSFLCIVFPFSNSYRNESCSKACTAHFANSATLLYGENKMEEQKRS